MPVEVRVEFCQQSSVVSTVSSKEQSLGSPRRRVNAEQRRWLVLFLRDTWALEKFPPEEGLLLLSCFSRVRLYATPIDGSPPGSPSLGFSRQEHWSGLPFPSPMDESEKWKWKVKVKSFSRVWFLVIPWTAAHQAPPSVGFSRQEYWSGVPLPSPEEGQEETDPSLPGLALRACVCHSRQTSIWLKTIDFSYWLIPVLLVRDFQENPSSP